MITLAILAVLFLVIAIVIGLIYIDLRIAHAIITWFFKSGDAENILFNMRDYINTYNDIQIVKLYELVEEQTGINIPMTAQDAKFGWSDLTNAGIRQVRGGYLLDLPNPIVLER